MSITPVRLAGLLIPPLTVMAVIFYLSAQPSAGDYPAWEVALRKLGHATGYALLALAWWRAFRGMLSPSDHFVALLAVAVSLAYAVSDEIHQTFVAGRHGSPVDVLVDAAGIAAALVLAIRLSRRPHALRRQET
jgi:VanZ family protein